MTRSKLDEGKWDEHLVLFVRPWLTADRMLQLVGLYIKLMREIRITDSYFFIYIDEILHRVGIDLERIAPTSGKHLNQT